jgi:dUTP pyrophosphatase
MSRKFHIVSKYIGTEIEKNIILPRRATKRSAGYDIYNNTGEDIVLRPGKSKAYTTFLKIEMNPSDVCLFDVRSSLGFSDCVRLANTIGVIDADYFNNPKNEGECFVKFFNPFDYDVKIPAGEAMAQAIFTTYLTTDDDEETVGGDRIGGIGSTSKS